MEIEDLRIGNLILDVQSKKPYPVTLEILQEISGGMDFYEPFPLTSDWLDRFGFVKDKNKQWAKDEYFILEQGENEYFNCIVEIDHGNDTMILASVKYIHQLQNLYFALEGKDLALKEPVKA